MQQLGLHVTSAFKLPVFFLDLKPTFYYIRDGAGGLLTGLSAAAAIFRLREKQI